MKRKYTYNVPLPDKSEEEKYKLLKYKKGDKLKAKFFESNAHKPKIKECTFLEKINNKFLLVSLGAYKECITIHDLC